MDFNEALKASLKLEDDMTMTAEEQAILERSKDRVAKIMGEPMCTNVPGIGPGVLVERMPESRPHISQACSSCGARIVRTGRNRLSDCGHMRMSGGGWVPREERPKPGVEKTPPGFITRDQFNLINHLHEKVGVARINLQDCEDATKKAADVFRDAETEYFNYLESITAKK